MTDARKQVCTFIVNYGSEYRNFFLSGLSDELGKHSTITVIKRDVVNSCFDEYMHNYNLSSVDLDEALFLKKRLRIENLFIAVRQSRLRLKRVSLFKNYNKITNDVCFKDYLKGNILVYSIFKSLVLWKIKDNYLSPVIQDILKKNNTTDIIISGYSSSGSIIFAVNALFLNMKVWVLVNSWKDIYINEFVPFIPTGLLVWSEQMKKEYLSLNRHLNKNQITATGNPIFDRFRDFSPSKDRHYYEDKYNIQRKQHILLYTMLDPVRYPDEVKLIKLIGDALMDSYAEDATPVILIRRNPFETTDSTTSHFVGHPCIRVADHFSKRDVESDFFSQCIEGENEWMDLLYYSSLNIGAASTVALEAIMLNKPVVTIGFDHNNLPSENLRVLAVSQFYKNLLGRSDVDLVMSIDGCLCSIKSFLQPHNRSHKIPSILKEKSSMAVPEIVERLIYL